MIREHSLFIGMFVLVTVLRFLPLFNYQFTLDELSGLNRTQFNSFSELIEKGVKIDAHPALIQVLLFYLVKLFGYTTWVIKLPFLIFSLGAIAYAYVFGLRNFSKQVGLLSVSLISFSLVFVFYAPIARMYISGVFFSISLLFHFYEIVFRKNEKTMHFVLLGLFALLSALNQHINALFALSVCSSGLFFLKSIPIRKYLITCGLTVLAYLPHLGITLYQLGVGGIDLEQGGWLEKPEATVVLNFLKILFGTGSVYLLLIGLLFFKNILDKTTKIGVEHLYLLFIFLINYLVIYFYSITKASVYQHSVMLFSGTAALIFVCSLLDFTNRFWFRLSLLILSLTLIYRTYWTKDYYKQSVSTVFEYQFQKTFDYTKHLGKNKVHSIFLDADEFMRKIYFNKYGSSFPVRISGDTLFNSTNMFAQELSAVKENYLVLSSAMPLHEAMAMNYFPYRLENTMTQSNNYRLYSRVDSDSVRTVNGEAVMFSSSLRDKAVLKYGIHSKGAEELYVDSLTEFPLDAKVPYIKLLNREGEVALLKLRCSASPQARKMMEACISVSDSLNGESYQYSASSASISKTNRDSSFTFYTQLFAGSKHNKIRNKASVLTFYVWNRAKEKFRILEFEIKVVDHWPQKWNYWK